MFEQLGKLSLFVPTKDNLSLYHTHESADRDWTITGSKFHEIAFNVISDLKDAHNKVLKLRKKNINFEHVFLPQVYAELAANDAMCFLKFLMETREDKRSIRVGEECVASMINTMDELRRDPVMYKLLVECKNKKENLDEESKILMSAWITEREAYGVHLEEDIRNQILKLDNEIMELEEEFSDNANKKMPMFLFYSFELAGVPADAFETMLRERGPEQRINVTFDPDHIMAVMSNCVRRPSRQRIARCVDISLVKNLAGTVEDKIAKRGQRARLLGFKSHADFIMRNESSRVSKNVKNFLDDISDMVNESLRYRELLMMRALKCLENGGVYNIRAGLLFSRQDYAYYSNLSNNPIDFVDYKRLREHFVLEHTLSEILRLIKTLFSLEFISVKPEYLWSPRVKLFAVIDRQIEQQTEQLNVIGFVYMDLYKRRGKDMRPGFYVVQNRAQNKFGKMQLGFYSMVLNIRKRSDSSPCFLNLAEVEAILFQLGHVIQSLSYSGKYHTLSWNYCAKDFVNVIPHFMKRFAYNPKFLKRLSRHYRSRKPLTDIAIQDLLVAREFMAGHHCLSKVSWARFDLNANLRRKPDLAHELYYTLSLDWPVELLPDLEFYARFVQMAPKMDGTLYAELWSEFIAEDIYVSKFLHNPDNSHEGNLLRNNVLKWGSSRSPRRLIKSYLGRYPSLSPLIKRYKSQPYLPGEDEV